MAAVSQLNAVHMHVTCLHASTGRPGSSALVLLGGLLFFVITYQTHLL